MHREDRGRQVLTLIVASLFFGSLMVMDAPKAKAAITQIIWNSNHSLTTDFIINPDEELLILPGVRVLLGPRVSLIIKGDIKAAANSGNPIIFDWFTPGQNWGNISLLNAQRPSHLNYTVITHGTNGIFDQGSQLDIELSNVSYNALSGINVSGAEVNVTDCSLTFNGQGTTRSDSAIYLDNARGNIVNNIMISNNNGLFIKNGSTVHVKYGQILGGTSPISTGVTVRSASPTIELVTMVNNYNGFVGNASHTNFKNNTVMNNARNGILLVNGDVSVLDRNDVNNNGNSMCDSCDGIEINSGSTPTLTNNDINSNDVRGVHVNSARPIMHANWIHGSYNTGLLITNGGNVTSTSDHISHNDEYGVFVEKSSGLISSWPLIENNGNQANVWVDHSYAGLYHPTVKSGTVNIYATNSSHVYIENGSASDPLTHNLVIDGSDVVTLNHTMTPRLITVAWGSTASLLEMWYLGVKVIDQHGNPIPGAGVNLTPLLFGSAVNRTTDAKGEVNWLALNESLREWSSGITVTHSASPYTLNVSKGTSSNSTSVPLTMSGNVTVILQLNLNQPPVLAVPFQNYYIQEDSTNYGLVNISGHFTDEGPLTYTISYEEEASKVHGVINGTKMDVFTPTKDWFGTRRFRIRATDNESLWVESNTFNVTVLPVNDPPVLQPLGPFKGIVNQTITGQLQASDVDDPPNAITFKSLTAVPAGVTLSLDPNSGVITFRAKIPGNYTIWFFACDVSMQCSNNISVSFNISYMNTPPSFTSLPGDTNVYIGGTFRYLVTAHDPDGDYLTLKLDLGPAGMKLNGWNLTWAPNATQLGQFAVVLNLTDGVNPPVFQRFNVTSHPTNHPPKPKILQPAAGAILYAGRSIQFRGSASDQDGDPVVVSWTVDGATMSAQLAFNASLDAGTHNVSLAASDGHVTAYDNITMVVKPAIPPPKKVRTSVDNTCFIIAAVVATICIVADVVYRKFRSR